MAYKAQKAIIILSKGNKAKARKRGNHGHDGQTVAIYFLADHNSNGQMPDHRRGSRNEQGNPEAFRRTYRSGKRLRGLKRAG